ncbi:hypothetical protein P5Y53_02560 [Dyella jiangningensis]|uniref:hypothetical protein n=1 Tax=Dyella jiangningensis TaxID=1379159 RepID=UPI002410A3A1|nr:hypothetical protein [Dyella jiangningensis]MDG2536540.1 hypothetical protein [Dyella jiangningensis]
MPRIATVDADTPFRERFIAGLAYPLRGGGLATCVVLALAHYLALLPSYIGVIAAFTLWGATWRYAATCLLHTANGYADPPDIGVDENPAAGNGLTAIHLFAFALCFVSGVFYPQALWPLVLLFALTLPAIDMSLAFDGSLELAMSPVNWWEVMRRFGWAYLIPVGLNLATGVLIVLASVAATFLPRLISLPLYAFAYTYLIILNLHLMGAMIHQRHESFDLEPEAEKLMREGGYDDDAHLLEQVRAVATTDRQAAIGMLVTRMQGRSAPAQLHQAYRELLRQEGLRDGLLEHGQIWIAVLLANHESRRALGLVQECIEIEPAFLPDAPEHADALANLAARSGMTRLALKLCRGYLAHWPRSPEAPRMGLLAARLLGDELDQRTEAIVLLGKLAAAWPEHPLHHDMHALARRLQDPQPRPA